MKIYPAQISQLKQLFPIYIVTGQEWVLVAEVIKHIHHYLHTQNYLDRMTHIIEKDFQWTTLRNQLEHHDLFSEKRLIELQFPDMPDERGKQFLKELSLNHTDSILLIILPKLDQKNLNAAWLNNLEKQGVLITVYPPKSFQTWLNTIIQKQGFQLQPQSLKWLNDHLENNFAAVKQLLDHLKLVAQPGILDHALIEEYVAQTGHYDVFKLTDAIFQKQGSNKILKILQYLQQTGFELAIIVWALAREVRNQLKNNSSDPHALNRIIQLAAIDRDVKTGQHQDAWSKLYQLSLS